MIKNHTHKLAVVLACAIALMGCGAKNSPNTESGSNDLASVGDRGDQTKPQATCNRVTEGDIDVKIMAYADGSGNKNNSLVRLKFLSVPAEFSTGTYDIHMVKWTASPNGAITPTSTESPLYVNSKFELFQGGIFNNASTWGFNSGGSGCSSCLSIDWNNINEVAKDAGISISTSNDFFSKFNLLMDLNDANGDWKVLQIIFKNKGISVKHVNILIPTFDANPEDYEKSHPAVLNNLHPFLSKKGQGFTASQFQSFANTNCF